MVNDEDIDASSSIAQFIAAATVGIVPAGDDGCTTNVGEVLEGTLGGVALGEESVASVGAGDYGERSAGIIVANVVGDGDGCCADGKGEESSESWELHFEFVWLRW